MTVKKQTKKKNKPLHNFIVIVCDAEVYVKTAFVTVRNEGVVNKREHMRESKREREEVCLPPPSLEDHFTSSAAN